MIGPTVSELSAFAGVVLIDLTLAGDNAIVVGVAAAGLPAAQRGRAILLGIAAATVLRVGFAVVASSLLAVVGLTLAGGILLLWVAWKMLRELRHPGVGGVGHVEGEGPPPKTLKQALIQIVVADVSMSIDNVLAVAGTAREHVWVLVSGLVLSVALMGVASSFVAGLMQRAPWLVWIGLAIITLVAGDMIWDGTREVHRHLHPVGT